LRRIDTVTVTNGHDTAILPRESREALLQRLGSNPAGAGIVTKFRDSGTSAPITLSDEEKTWLRSLIDRWAHQLGIDELPEGVWEVRCVITDEPT
jgi:hypothetical protein